MKKLQITPSITLRDEQSFDLYLKEIEKIPLLTAKEETELAKKMKEGDVKALNKLIRSNLRFVVSVAKKFQYRGLSLGDLVNEGNIGLVVAAKRFDVTKGVKFISYAVWWIRQYIVIAIMKYADLITLPYKKHIIIQRIQRCQLLLEQQYQRAPTVQELAEDCHLPEQAIRESLQLANRELYLDIVLRNGEYMPILDLLSQADDQADHLLMKDSLIKEIQVILMFLNPSDRNMLECYFGLNDKIALPLEEIAKKINISVRHVYRKKEEAINQLRGSLYAPILRSFIE